ncbi:MAG: hypothetical protein ACRDKY_12190, partial [Solirubrobacteraceae bacterium]
MSASELAFVRGLADTRATLNAWNDEPWPVLCRWLAGALGITAVLLAAVWLVAVNSQPDPSGLTFPGLRTDPTFYDVRHVLFRNGLVLALHAMACVAGFIAGSSLPQQARHHTGAWRWVHEKAGPLAILFVIGATGFSLITQAFVLGEGTATLAWQLDISPALLLVGL